LVVTHTGDTGMGSLREAINCANTSMGLDTISFSLSADDALHVYYQNDGMAGQVTPANVATTTATDDSLIADIDPDHPHSWWSIQPDSPLPAITDPVIIDGTTQTGAGCGNEGVHALRIEISGGGAGATTSGLVVTAGGSTVRGLVINGFTQHGIVLQEMGGSTVACNYVGTDVAGTNDLGNSVHGILVFNSPNNTIGGTAPQDRNLASGNEHSGIVVFGSSASGNTIQGNVAGLDSQGSEALGNSFDGILISRAPDNTVGGSEPGARNVASGNVLRGIEIAEIESSGNVVQGNYTGTDISGTIARPNGENGILVYKAPNNTIGGTQTGAGNLASGNGTDGILIEAPTASGNLVQGNLVGLQADGVTELGNSQEGILIQDAPNNTIGGTEPGARNVASGNGFNGIIIFDTEATGNVVQGNLVGTDVSGMVGVGNGYGGVAIEGAPNNTIGGTAPGAGNVISGNTGWGVGISQFNPMAPTTGNVVQGNLIGLGNDGQAPLGNTYIGVAVYEAANNTIGGTESGAGNVISANGLYGIGIAGSGASGNLVQGNYIGTDQTGRLARGNNENGIVIGQAPDNVIGGTATGAANVICDHKYFGVLIAGMEATGNLVQGNHIGTDVDGELPLGNGGGVQIQDAANNTVGGTAPGAGNLIAANDGSGVAIIQFDPASPASGNLVQGNRIGVKASGTEALGNLGGVVIADAADNTIGGIAEGARNVISGNAFVGVYIGALQTTRTTGNVVQGNYIGVDESATAAIPNGPGDAAAMAEKLNEYVLETLGFNPNLTADDVEALRAGIAVRQASGNTIGGAVAGAENVISGNVGAGVALVEASGNLVQNNWIGTEPGGTMDLGNGSAGVSLIASNDNDVLENTIAFNSITIPDTGVVIDGGSGNVLLSNLIFSNQGLGIDLLGGMQDGFGVTANDDADPDDGSNNLQNYPVLDSATVSAAGTTIVGNLNSLPDRQFVIEFFSSTVADPSGFGEGQTRLGDTMVTTDGSGVAPLNVVLGQIPLGSFVTATATLIEQQIPSTPTMAISLPDGFDFVETSEFSNAVEVTGEQYVDYGDAPDTGTGTGIGNYHTLSTDNGPSHIIVSGLMMGAEVDGESEALQSAAADGDDSDGDPPDDEDGLSDPAVDLALTERTAPAVHVTVTNLSGSEAMLYGWIDYNGDGIFDNAAERASIDVPNDTTADVVTLTFPAVPVGSAGDTFARFRLSTDRAGQEPTGAANDGEVEDYAVTIEQATCRLVVTHTGDTGTGSLREAIHCANSLLGLDTITFNIPGTGPHTIQPLSQLPIITDPVVIDGYTQPDAQPNTNPVGQGLNTMLMVELDGSNAGSARGLEITAGGSTVRGLAINRFSSVGILVDGSSGNRIEGNFLGTDVAGEMDLGNGSSGVFVGNSSGNTIGGLTPAARNLISGNDTGGAVIQGMEATDNAVQGNLIGTTADGMSDVGNGGAGVAVIAPGNTVGGPDPEARNVISANANGVEVVRPNNLVENNWIGTDVLGTGNLGNLGPGVLLAATGNQAAARAAMSSQFLPSTFNKSTVVVTSNFIAFNSERLYNTGIAVLSNATGIVMMSNSVFDNDGLGIDLNDDGVTPNDNGDLDTGGNNLQNFPVITSATTSTSTIIEGTLSSLPDTTYRIEFFANTASDPSGYGEGETPLGTTDVTTNSSGEATFSFDAGSQLPPGSFVTATATLVVDQLLVETSEFSAAVEVVVETPALDFGDAPDVDAGTGTGNYNTLSTDDGPSHVIVSGLMMGAHVDDEAEALQSAAADGDDTDGAAPDDEDGLSDPAADLALTEGDTPMVDVIVTNTIGSEAMLYGWIDYNGDGIFDNATERASFGVPHGTNVGIVTLTFPTVPAGSADATFARFRLSTSRAVQDPTGAVGNGEVEDYPVTIVEPGSIAGRKWLDANGDGDRDDGEEGLEGWTIFLDENYNGLLDDGEPRAFTLPDNPQTVEDEAGMYLLDGIKPGPYLVGEQLQVGWSQTLPHFGPQIERVSVASDGTEADSFSAWLSINADGRYVAFSSLARNLVPVETNNRFDVFVHDRQTGTTEAASVALDGTTGKGNSAKPSISGEGRYVAFESSADDLVMGDANQTFDVFVYDRQSQVTQRVSVAADGSEANAASRNVSLSADSRYVVFSSLATNLVPDDTNDEEDAFLYDRQTGDVQRISVTADGSEGNDASTFPSVSGDGRYVAFISQASNLVAVDTNDAWDVFVSDRWTGQVARVSVASDGTQANDDSGTTFVAISPDGRYVAFESRASNLVPNDTNNTGDIFVYDRHTGLIERASVAADGTEGNGQSYYPSISGNGRYVAFSSEADNLVPGDGNGMTDVFVHDRQSGTIRRVSVAADGTEANGRTVRSSISADGRYVAFESEAYNLVPDDTSSRADIFVNFNGPSYSPDNRAVVVPAGEVVEEVDFGNRPLLPSQENSISGYVYADVNNNGVREPHERVLPNVPVVLEGPISRSTVTNEYGYYQFMGLPSGVYTVVETQPATFNDGIDRRGTPPLGTVENDRFVGLPLTGGLHCTDYNFGERGLKAKYIGKHLYFASTPPAGGQIVYLTADQERDTFAFQASESGELTVDVNGEGESLDLQLFTDEFLPVGFGQDGRLSVPVEGGQVYILYVGGAGRPQAIQLTIDDQPPVPDVSGLFGDKVVDPAIFDINGDGVVSPLDPLLVINYLNQQSGSRAVTPETSSLDVTGDGLISPLDVLYLIAYLNSFAGSGEGEAPQDEATGIKDDAALAKQFLPTASPHDLAIARSASTDHLRSSTRHAASAGTLYPEVRRTADEDRTIEELRRFPWVTRHASDPHWATTVAERPPRDDHGELATGLEFEDALSDIVKDISVAWRAWR
jgi:hypothetical protein